jgi:hypothetical protein
MSKYWPHARGRRKLVEKFRSRQGLWLLGIVAAIMMGIMLLILLGSPALIYLAFTFAFTWGFGCFWESANQFRNRRAPGAVRLCGGGCGGSRPPQMSLITESFSH